VLVSVVMASYNAEATVGAAIDSVREQTHQDWELLIADDGSTDGTCDVAVSYGEERIKLLPSPHLGVLAAVRNRAIDVACGDAIALLDADDVWRPEKLERQLAVLASRPGIGVVHSSAALFDGASTTVPPRPATSGPLLRRLLETNFVYSSSALVRRALLDEHGAFDPDPALAGAPDYDLWLRLAPHTQFALVDEPLLLYRIHPGQMSGDGRAMHEASLVALDKLAARDPEVVRAEAAAYAFGRGMRLQLAGRPGGGRREFIAALRVRPVYPLAWRWLLRSFVSSS
jgi:glycosyltransferase involved in cell wall biosynthesis